MTSTFADIREALKERIATTGVRALTMPPPDFIGNELPVAYINLINASYARTFGGDPLDGQIQVTILAASGENDEGYMALDEYLSAEGSKSIVKAIEEDSSLGLPDISTGVMGFQNAGIRNMAFREGSALIWGAEIIVNYVKRS